jgi:hypothetical protein
MMALFDEEYEKVFLDRWSQVVKKDKKSTRDLFLCDNFILWIHGCIQQEKVIVFINPSSTHNFIIVNLDKRLQVPTNKIQSTQFEGKNVQIFKDLKITMDTYLLHLDFHAIDMGDVDIVLGYSWMDSVGTVNINVQMALVQEN